jgi:hypothetical protein
MTRFGFAEVLVSEHDILDGIATSLVPVPARCPVSFSRATDTALGKSVSTHLNY